jgi:hypothetical protein
MTTASITAFCPHCGTPMACIVQEYPTLNRSVQLGTCFITGCALNGHTLSICSLSDADTLARYGALLRFDVCTGARFGQRGGITYYTPSAKRDDCRTTSVQPGANDHE